MDEAVLQRLVRESGAALDRVYGKRGKDHLKQRLRGYNQAARYAPWIVLIDLDQDTDCAPPLRTEWLPDSSPYMCFRIAVRAVESWLFADRKSMAHFLGVTISQIPPNPEGIDQPKATLVQLARRSKRRKILEEMVPRPGSGRSEGPAYSSQLIDYVRNKWRPEVAALSSESLRKCRNAILQLVKSGKRQIGPKH